MIVLTGNHHLEVRADLVADRAQIDVGEHEADDDKFRQVVKHGNRHQSVVVETFFGAISGHPSVSLSAVTV